MTALDLEALIANGESASLEFKRSLSDSHKIIETIAAMATIGGGTIVIGVRDDGAVAGVTLGRGDVERFVQQVLAQTDPKIYVDVAKAKVAHQTVVVIRVPPGDGPHLAFGRAFYRSGPATVGMTRDEYERRLLDRLRDASGYERRVEDGASWDDIDEDAVRALMASSRDRLPGKNGKETPRTALNKLHLANGDKICVGGLLLFGKDPTRFFPQAVIRARVTRGHSSDAANIEGPLFRQIGEAVRFIERNERVRTERTALQRQEHPEIPRAALREAIANAVAHRDYRSTAPTQIVLDESQLSVWNPGHLPDPLTPASLRLAHPSVPTNPLIARALYLAGYIEEWGTGTLRIIDEMRANDNPEPQFQAQAGGILVSLPIAGSMPSALGERQQKGLKLLRAGKPLSSAQYAKKFAVSARSANLDLQHLETLGLVKRLGQGKTTRWVGV
jgi:ATP-dependent DNA helicase RecG